MLTRLFTYGSLMPGGSYSHLLDAAPGDWQQASVTGFLDMNGWGHTEGYPALIISNNGYLIEGMLLTSPLLIDLLPSLDEFEGASYQRIVSEINLSDGNTVQAYLFELSKKLKPANLV